MSHRHLITFWLYCFKSMDGTRKKRHNFPLNIRYLLSWRV